MKGDFIMASIQVLFRYPTNIMYQKREGDDPIAYLVTSVFAKDQAGSVDLYREIVRVSDKAVQILRTDKPGSIFLYTDAACKINSLITITDEWSYKMMPREVKIVAPSAL